MPIAQLPAHTTQYLKSTVALNDASSAVKELLDNALDSSATIITIEVSENALDVIQVKDNGIGIGIEDRQLLCKRGCTSKIRTLLDLENLGGSHLGFRGEALSSIAEVSEHVTITTRIEGEVVGTAMKFGQNGQLLSSISASHPVGTTVRVQNFLCHLPVRKQVAIKTSSKVLGKVKQLLVTCAFTRPNVRSSLKILKHENDKHNWSFAPAEAPLQLMATATRLFGKDVGTQCTTHKASIKTMNGAKYDVDALLICTSNPGKPLDKSGQYFAIDGRPMTAERGLLKDILKLYKRYLQSSIDDSHKVSTKPFIVFQITCPRGSYDVNIEPAKDEVLFHQPEAIIELAEKLFTEAYGEITQGNTKPLEQTRAPAKSAHAFDVLLARKKIPSNCEEQARVTGQDKTHSANRTRAISEESERSELSLPSPGSRTTGDDQPGQVTAFEDMYEIDDNNVIHSGERAGLRSLESNPVSVDVGEDSTGNSARNPFTTAALHARIRPVNVTRGKRLDDQLTSTAITTNNSSSSPMRIVLQPQPSIDIPYLPTPSRSPKRTEPDSITSHAVSQRSKHTKYDNRTQPVDSGSVTRSQGLLHDWIQSSCTNQSFSDSTRRSSPTQNLDRNLDPSDDQYYGTQTIKTANASLKSHPLQTSQRPFPSPVRTSNPTSYDTPSTASIGKAAPGIHNLTAQSELDEIMNFEHRKKQVNQRTHRMVPNPGPADLARLQLATLKSTSQQKLPFPSLHVDELSDADIESQPKESVSRSNPHSNRYYAALRHLQPPDQNEVSNRREDHDFRINNEQADDDTPSMDLSMWPWKSIKLTPSSQMKKAKIIQLPLEKIPKEDIKHNLICIPDHKYPRLFDISEQTTFVLQHDNYIKTGKIQPVTWSPFSPCLLIWSNKLNDLINTKYRSRSIALDFDTDSDSPRIQIDLTTAIKCHLQMLSE